MHACPICGTEFGEPVGAAQFKIYCSRRCKTAASHRRRQVGATIPVKTCGVCGAKFTPAKYSRYCSSRCRAESSRRARGVKPKAPAVAPVPCQTCGTSTSRGNFCSPKCCAEFQRTCAECGEMFTPASHGIQQYCSIPCRRKWNNRLGRRRGKPWAVASYASSGGWTSKKQGKYQLRRALIKGATAPGEFIIPADVFKRDGWLCGLCGADVDPLLKYPNPWSVSLDHVVPVSKGGAHSMANVQCSHLRCNLSKGNRVEQEAQL